MSGVGRLTEAMRAEKDEFDDLYEDYYCRHEGQPMSEEEMDACDHCDEPWKCRGMCLDNLMLFRSESYWRGS